MDIKEIALKVADSLRNKVDGVSHMQSNQGLVRFAEALVESYKAELLNEVGEPVIVLQSDDFGWGIYTDSLENASSGSLLNLYTSDQVAAAIIKATKPLEDQLAAAQEEGATVTSERDNLWFKLETAKAELADLRDQLAKAEQRVAEACALTYLEDYDLTDIACAIRRRMAQVREGGVR